MSIGLRLHYIDFYLALCLYKQMFGKIMIISITSNATPTDYFAAPMWPRKKQQQQQQKTITASLICSWIGVVSGSGRAATVSCLI